MIRIALISDIHFGQLARTVEFSVPGEPIKDENSGGESLKANTISILKNEDVRYLCIAGDLTSVGSPQEFKYCEDMLLDLAQSLGLPNDHIFLGLGNHDIDWKISELHNKYGTSHPDFPRELVQERYRRIAASAPLMNLESIPSPNEKGPAPYTGIIENDDFVMFVLNTGWYCTEDQAISHGKLDGQQLKWFSKNSEKYRSSNKWKIVLMHHHPLNYSYPVSNFDTSLLEEGSEFLDIAGKNGVHLVLHGHRHHPRAETIIRSTWKNPITFICAGSFAVNSTQRYGGSIPNTLHIVELTDVLGVIRLFSFQFSPARGWIPFVENSPETPLDSIMMLGKIFDSKDIEKAIQQLASKEGEIKWADLDECLQFMPINDLNEQMRTQLSNTHKMVGSFPDDIVLLKKEGQK